jgi:putative ABC transport system permease protein
MTTLLQDLRYGIRMLLKRPGFTAVAVITLALGIGASTTIFSFVNGILLRPLPYEKPERLVLVDENAPKRGITSMGVSFPNYLDWREQNTAFEHLSAYDTGGFTLLGGDEPERLRGGVIAYDLFETLGVSPILGRTFLAEEDRPNQDTVVILSHGLWQRRFGADAGIIGQTVTINSRARTVIGVMPPGFNFPEVAELWAPLALDTKSYTRTDHGLSAIARLKPGVTLQQAQTEMDTIASRIEAQNPVTNEGLGVNLIALREGLVSDYRQALLILLGVVGFVLLIACANVANLLLARAATRQKEMAIRAALGASTARIFRQLLTESLLLGVMGGALGLVLALWGLDLLLAAIPDQLPFWMKFSLDGRVLGFTIGIALLTGLIFGVAPALQAAHPDLNETLKEGGRSSGGGSRHGLRRVLVITEVALSLVLLIGAGLMMRSFMRLQHVNPGFNPQNVLTLQVALPQSKYPKGEQRQAFFQQLLERVGALPGVRNVSAVSHLPLSGNLWGRSLTIEGRPVLPVGQAPMINHCVIEPDYFQTMGIPIVMGRDVNAADTSDTNRVTIIDERLAREYWPNESPLGKRIRFGPPEDNEPWHTIVGVVGEVRHQRLDTVTRMSVYLPYQEIPTGRMTLAVRTTTNPTSLASAVRDQVRELDRQQPVMNVQTMETVINTSVWQSRLYTMLFGVFGIVALILATVGIYGVMSYTVAQRTREIGLRMALGARSQDVLRLVVGQGAWLTAIGVGIGIGASLALTRLMSSLLFSTSATDPLTFALTALGLAGVALGACFIPARRAAKVDPMVALRYE